MPDAITNKLVAERESIVTRAAAIKTTAVEQNRDLNDSDKTALASYSERVAEIDGQLDLVSTSFELDDSIRDRLARVSPGSVMASETNYRTAGDLVWDMLHRQHDPEADRRFVGVLKRAAQHMGTTAEATTPVAGGMPGLIVKPVVGPVIDVMPQGRPFLTALGVNDAPSSLTFMRPRIVDPDFATGVGTQALEKAELASKKFDVLADPVNLVTVGGYLNVSEQLRAFVAGALDLIVAQMNRRLARATEVAAVTELEKSTAKVTLADDADAAAVLQAIYDASAMVYANTGSLATWIAMGPEGWARLGGLSDLAGRPLFPFMGAVNAPGTASASSFAFNPSGPAGLNPVVTPAIDDNTFWVGNALALEAYEYRYPLLEAIEPSLLGRQIAVASSIGFYRPTTTEAGPGGTPPAQANGAVHIAP